MISKSVMDIYSQKEEKTREGPDIMVTTNLRARSINPRREEERG
jgi:hypothetical protein